MTDCIKTSILQSEVINTSTMSLLDESFYSPYPVILFWVNVPFRNGVSYTEKPVYSICQTILVQNKSYKRKTYSFFS